MLELAGIVQQRPQSNCSKSKSARQPMACYFETPAKQCQIIQTVQHVSKIR